MSRIIPFLIAALVVVFLITRLTRGRAGRAQRAGLPSASLAAANGAQTWSGWLLPLPGDIGLIGLVAARELRERVRSRRFRIGTLLVLAAVAAAIAVPALLGKGSSAQRVGVTGALSAPLRAAVVAAGPATGATVRLVPELSRAAAVAGLRDGGIDLAIIDGRQILVKSAAAQAGTSVTAQLARAAASVVGSGQALTAADLTAAQARAIAAARPLPVVSLQPDGAGTTRRNTSLAGLALVAFLLIQYNTWTLTGVLEEKTSRVVEVLLAAITPARLLAGKVLGIGLTVFFQAGLAVATALTVARVTGSGVLHGTTPLAIAATLTWLVLGYAFYSWVYAAAGATAARQGEVQSLTFPLALPVMFGYAMALATATSGNASALVRVLGYLPPTAPFVMPVLVGLGAVSWWQFAASAVISIGCTIGVARVAVAVYGKAILRTSSRVRLRELVTR